MTTTFDIAQDATATFAAYPWVLSDKGDGGGASETVVESDLDVKNGALWANNVCKALRQTNEVFQGSKFIDKLGIGVVAGAAALRTTGGDVVLDTSDLYVSAGDLYVGSQAIVGSTGMAFAGNALNVAGNGGRILAYDDATDATVKGGRFMVPHYTNAEEPFLVVRGLTTATQNVVNIGGVDALFNAATDITFYTAANNTTTGGTLRGVVESNGTLSWVSDVIATGAVAGGFDVLAGTTARPFSGHGLSVRGSVVVYDVATDATVKQAIFTSPAFTNAQGTYTLVAGFANGSNNVVRVGGGPAGSDAVTLVEFYTAAALDTAAGTLRGTITSGGALSWAGEVEIDGALNHDGTTVGLFGVTPAVRPPAYTITNDVADRSFDADTVTTPELADVVATMIRDLITIGALQ